VLLHQQPLLEFFAHQLRRWPLASCNQLDELIMRLAPTDIEF